MQIKLGEVQEMDWKKMGELIGTLIVMTTEEDSKEFEFVRDVQIEGRLLQNFPWSLVTWSNHSSLNQ